MFPAAILDHFRSPHRAGALAGATATGRAENPVCGDVLELDLRLEDGAVADLRFRAQGCVPVLACASALTDLALGLSAEAARALTPDALAAALGGLPDGSAHAAGLAVEALRAALAGAAAERRRG